MSNSADKRESLFDAPLAGVVLALAAILVPLLEIPTLIWARLTFFQLHPDYAARTPPTISRAISDPIIGDPFAMLILFVTALIAIAVLPIAIGYRNSIHLAHPPGSRARRSSLRLLAAMLALQVLASAGMVVCTQYTFANGHDLHMAGSYVFFFGQATVILMSGHLSANIAKTAPAATQTWTAQRFSLGNFTLDAGMHRRRARASRWVVAIALIFFALYIAKDLPLPIDSHGVRTAFTITEIATISALMLYLGMFAPELYRIGGAKRSLTVASSPVTEVGLMPQPALNELRIQKGDR